LVDLGPVDSTTNGVAVPIAQCVDGRVRPYPQPLWLPYTFHAIVMMFYLGIQAQNASIKNKFH